MVLGLAHFIFCDISSPEKPEGLHFSHSHFTYIHCESKKLGHFYFYCNFVKVGGF